MLAAGARVAGIALLLGLTADFVSEVWAVAYDPHVIYNDRPSETWLRLLGCVLTVAVAAGLSEYATRSGLGRQFGLWIGCGLAVAGIAANGVASMLWSRGVPDFIPAGGGWRWNVADFEIVIGVTAGLLSLGVAAVAAYVRTARASRPVPDVPFARSSRPAREHEDQPGEPRDRGEDEEPLDDDDREHDPENDECREQQKQDDHGTMPSN